MGATALMVPEYVAATSAASAALPALAGAAGATGGILGASEVANAAAPGTLESMGLLEVSPGNFIDPSAFVGEGMGMPLYTGGPDLPFTERMGNFFGSIGDKFIGNGFDPLKAVNTMRQFGQSQGSQRPMAQQGPRLKAQPAGQMPAMYGQAPSGVQLTPEQREELKRRMYGYS